MIRRTAGIAILALLAAACSSSSPPPANQNVDAGGVGTLDASDEAEAASAPCMGSASVTGTFMGGATLVAKDAITAVGAETVITIADVSGFCGLDANPKASSSTLVFNLHANTPTAGMTISVGSSLDASYTSYDSTCTAANNESANGGSVKFTQVDTCGATGTFSLIFPGAQAASGSFVAPYCTTASSSPMCH